MKAKQKWLYLSFSGAKGFQGAAYVCGDGTMPFCVNGLPKEPIEQIAIIVIPQKMAHKVPQDHKYHDRLLSKKELFELEKGEIVNARGEAVKL